MIVAPMTCGSEPGDERIGASWRLALPAGLCLALLSQTAFAAPIRSPSRPAQAPRSQDMSNMRTQRNDLTTNGEQKARTPIHVDKKIGRNDPCPCGSGKKYKNCHGAGLV